MDTAIREEVRIWAGPVALEGVLELPSACNGIVVFSHGSGSGRNSPRNNYVAGELRRHALGTLLLDLLTREEERIQENRFDIALLATRLDAACEWLHARPETASQHLGLFGASTGAAAALQVAAMRGSDISAVVSRGGRPDLAGARALGAVTAPTLLIVGSRDQMVLSLNREALAAMHGECDLVEVPGATHLFEEPGTLEQVASLACGWFARHCRTLLPGQMGARQGAPGSPRR